MVSKSEIAKLRLEGHRPSNIKSKLKIPESYCKKEIEIIDTIISYIKIFPNTSKYRIEKDLGIPDLQGWFIREVDEVREGLSSFSNRCKSRVPPKIREIVRDRIKEYIYAKFDNEYYVPAKEEISNELNLRDLRPYLPEGYSDFKKELGLEERLKERNRSILEESAKNRKSKTKVAQELCKSRETIGKLEKKFGIKRLEWSEQLWEEVKDGPKNVLLLEKKYGRPASNIYNDYRRIKSKHPIKRAYIQAGAYRIRYPSNDFEFYYKKGDEVKVLEELLKTMPPHTNDYFKENIDGLRKFTTKYNLNSGVDEVVSKLRLEDKIERKERISAPEQKLTNKIKIEESEFLEYTTNPPVVRRIPGNGYIVTPEKLARAIQVSVSGNKKTLDKKEARGLAEHVLNFFGFSNRIIDNVLESEDRNPFYTIKESGILKTEREGVIRYDGRPWTIYYWRLDKERIKELLRNNLKKEKKEDYSIYNQNSIWQRPEINQ